MAFSREKNLAIRKFCLECVAGSPSEVKFCPSKRCPLFPFRMGSLSKAEQIDGVNYRAAFLNEKVTPFGEDYEEEED